MRCDLTRAEEPRIGASLVLTRRSHWLVRAASLHFRLRRVSAREFEGRVRVDGPSEFCGDAAMVSETRHQRRLDGSVVYEVASRAGDPLNTAVDGE